MSLTDWMVTDSDNTLAMSHSLILAGNSETIDAHRLKCMEVARLSHLRDEFDLNQLSWQCQSRRHQNGTCHGRLL